MRLIGAGIALILLGGAAAVLARRRPAAADAAFRVLVLGGCALAAIPALMVLAGATVAPASVMPALPGGPWVAGLDSLSAWFVLLLCVVGGATASYGVSYLAHDRPTRGVAGAHAMCALILAAMFGVFLARSILLFLMSWEAMALAGYFLIVFEHEQREARRAGLIYLAVTHAGTLALIVMFLLWSRSSPTLTFAALAAAGGPARDMVAILLLALVGFGAKAGMVPLHFWLPGAHASAPSHASALLSGVMIKTGIYGILRVLVLSGAPPAWWGWTVLLIGLASALLGVLWALAQHDLKRLLAYSSVENVGIILSGIGLGALGAAHHRPAIALLGFGGALLHSLNHALFKSLLFLGAGAVARATGTREIDRMGGLARAMPRTAAAFLIGSLAIVGLPPLNGFVGEWVVVQGFLMSARDAGPGRSIALVAAVIGLVAALALACFARAFGTVFLGRPRDGRDGAAGSTTTGMAVPLAVLSAACLTIGLAPRLVVSPALRAAAALSAAGAGASDVDRALLLGGATGIDAISLMAVAGALLAAAIWGLRAAALRRVPRGAGATWGCAGPATTPRMQYTASSFGAPLLHAFPMVTAPETVRRGGALVTIPEDRVMRGIALPSWERLQAMARALRPLQQGRVTTYLQYLVWCVLLLLGWVFVASLGAGGQP